VFIKLGGSDSTQTNIKAAISSHSPSAHEIVRFNDIAKSV